MVTSENEHIESSHVSLTKIGHMTGIKTKHKKGLIGEFEKIIIKKGEPITGIRLGENESETITSVVKKITQAENSGDFVIHTRDSVYELKECSKEK